MDSTCNFCEYQYDFAVIIKKALYEKYSSSQNYTYIRTINDLIFARRSRITNTFKDYLFWDYHDEYMENYFHSPKDLLLDTINSNSQKFVPHIFHTPIAKTMNNYYNPKIRQSRKYSNINSISVSKILKSSLIQKQQQYSSKGSIFFIKSQLNDIVTNSSLSFQTINNNKEVGVQLRMIYQKFCDRRQEIKKQKVNKKSQAHSIDKETQTQTYQFMPIIYHKDKQFLQKIIKQQKEKESTQIQFQKLNKQNKTSRYRNSVEINNNRYGSASKISQQSTARVYESNVSSRYNSTATQQKIIRSQRTKSQTQDSNTIIFFNFYILFYYIIIIILPFIENIYQQVQHNQSIRKLQSNQYLNYPQFNNQIDIKQTLKRFDSGIKQQKVK